MKDATPDASARAWEPWTVRRVAAELGVSESRVRFLVREGDLDATRIGGRWLVDPGSVDRWSRDRYRSRPLSPSMAWGLINMLESGHAPWLSASARSRLRIRLRRQPSLSEVAGLTRSRARVEALRVHPAAIPRLLESESALRAGVSAPGHDVVAAGFAEVYVREEDVSTMKRQFQASTVPMSQANLLVRIPTLDPWPLTGEVAGPVAVAVDLWEWGDSRSRRAAQGIYRRELSTARFDAT